MEITVGSTTRPMSLAPRTREAQLRGMPEVHLPETLHTRIVLSFSSNANLRASSTRPCKTSNGTSQAEPRYNVRKRGGLSNENPLRQLPSFSVAHGNASRPPERGRMTVSCSMEQANVSTGGEGDARINSGSTTAATALPELERQFAPPNEAATPAGPTSLIFGRPTGGALGFKGATEALLPRPMTAEKHVVLVRHGLSSWNEEGRVQGELQALRCREALRFIPFDCCFASPLERAKMSAEIIWKGRSGPLEYLDCLREANLLFLEGMLNSEARLKYPEEFRAWREDPANFNVDGVYPVRRLWDQARDAWTEILNQQGSTALVVTHKSLLRALLCTALGMGPERFRAIDVNNGGICVMKVSKSGEPMVESLNLTSHLQCEAVHYNL